MRRDMLRTVLTAMAVALGVAVVIAIELAGEAAAGSFRSSVETLAGSADFEVTATGGVPPETLTKLAMLPYALTLQPRIEDYAVFNKRTVPLIGVDLLTERKDDNGIWVGDGLGLKTGDHATLLINDLSSDFIVQGVLGTKTGDVIVMDLAVATRVLGRNGNLDRILISVPPGKTLEEWQPLFGMPVALQGSRTNENRRMLAAFRWNLRV